MLPNTLLFLLSSAILWYVIKYRIHVHVTISTSSRGPLSSARKPGRRAEANRRPDQFERATATVPTAKTRPANSQETTPVLDIQSALVNLGCKPHRARAAAEHVTRNWPEKDFDAQLRAAIQEVAA